MTCLRRLAVTVLALLTAGCAAIEEPAIPFVDVLSLPVFGQRTENLLENDDLPEGSQLIGFVGSIPEVLQLKAEPDGEAEVTSLGGTPGDEFEVVYQVDVSGRIVEGTLIIQLDPRDAQQGSIMVDPDPITIVGFSGDFPDEVPVQISIEPDEGTEPPPGEFAISIDVFPGVNFAVTNLCNTISVAEPCLVFVGFTAERFGEFSEALSVEIAGFETKTIELNGTHEDVTLEVLPREVRFKNRTVGDNPERLTFSLVNSASIDVEPSLALGSDALSASFGDCALIKAKSKCTFWVELSTRRAARLTDDVFIETAMSGDLILPTSGLVRAPIESPALNVSENLVTIENPADQIKFTVRNIGNVVLRDISLSGLTLGLGGSLDDSCAALKPGATCSGSVWVDSAYLSEVNQGTLSLTVTAGQVSDQFDVAVSIAPPERLDLVALLGSDAVDWSEPCSGGQGSCPHTVTWQVSNNGNVALPAGLVHLTLSGNNRIWEFEYPELAPNQTYQRANRLVGNNCFNPDCLVTLIVDPDNEISEVDEKNNRSEWSRPG